MEAVREFLGWCTVINFGLMMIALISLLALRRVAIAIHTKMFGLDEATVQRAYFQFFANFKIAILVFNLVPYLALRIMA